MTTKANLRLAAALLAAMIVIAVVLAVETKPSHAAFPGKNGHIAFASDRSGNVEIFQMNADGSHPVNLTLTPAVDDHRPSYSGNGQKIVFDSGDGGNNQEIYSMSSNGLLQTRLTRNNVFDVDPAFSADGKKIAFSSSRITGSQEIFVMNSNVTGVKQLTDHVGASFSPTFSPDGSKIAFVSNRDGDPEIFVMNSVDTNNDGNGDNQHRLTKNTLTDDSPDWSPSGGRIAFHSTRTGDFEVFTMSAVDANHDGQGDDPRNLTNTTGQDLDPVYSPSGTRIAFQSNRDSNAEIYVMDTDPTTDDAINRTNNPATDFEASWQPLP